jgi:Ca2+-binding RTX toxin-like protein
MKTPCYVSWRDFGNHLLHSNSLKGFIMAYSRDAILSSYSNNTSLNYWNNLQASNNAADASTYVAALSSAADAAILDNNFMGNAWTGTSVNALDPNYQGTSGNQDFQKISLWIGGLAEARVPGGMLGPTHNFIYSYQMQQLERGDENYYLSKLGGTDLLASIQGKVLADLVMESTGVRHLYHKIFAVNDADYELDSESNLEFNSNAALSAATKTVTDIFGVSQTVGLAGYVNDVFIGNGGNYLDARGELNPNGIGNASEMFGGTDDADTIKGLGGDDCIWGDGGNDVAYGGTGNDFIDGGTGNDNIFGEAGNDLLRGGDGNDDMFGGSENDDMYGGEGNDRIFGETGSDDINGQAGNDQLFGGDDVDTLKGGEGNDKLYGEAGSDVLTGGMGNDSFYFDQPLATTGIDRITDFSPNLDKLVLSSVIYSQLSINGIGVNQFESIAGSSTANVIAESTRSSTRIVYNSNNGSLSYDIDGAGTSPGVQIATLSKFNAYFPSDVISAQALFPILTASDFIIIG